MNKNQSLFFPYFIFKPDFIFYFFTLCKTFASQASQMPPVFIPF
jgi:hypothetical protein